uniref:Uncharacterized protein n=1 Tax=Opuntia streptacantha TaxID=393608 RepID=A0A7C8ZBN1_OPUST
MLRREGRISIPKKVLEEAFKINPPVMKYMEVSETINDTLSISNEYFPNRALISLGASATANLNLLRQQKHILYVCFDTSNCFGFDTSKCFGISKNGTGAIQEKVRR